MDLQKKNPASPQDKNIPRKDIYNVSFVMSAFSIPNGESHAKPPINKMMAIIM